MTKGKTRSRIRISRRDLLKKVKSTAQIRDRTAKAKFDRRQYDGHYQEQET